MKRFLLAVLAVFCLAMPASGSDNMVWQTNGYYLNVNGLGQNDGWYWERYRSCGCNHSCHCRGWTWKWRKVYRVADYAGVPGYSSAKNNSSYTVNYSNTWKEKLVEQLGSVKREEIKLQDAALFIQAVKESGLQVNPYSLPGAMYGGYGGQYGQGFSFFQQGYGSTAYGTPQQQPNIVGTDIGALVNVQSQATARAQDYGGQANAMLAERIGQVAEAQGEVAKVQAAGDAIVAAIQAAQTRKEEVKTWSTAPAGSGGARAMGAKVLPGIRGQVLFNQYCASCHSGGENKTALAIETLGSLASEDRAKLSASSWEKMAAGEMPKDQPILPVDVRGYIAEFIASGTVQ